MRNGVAGWRLQNRNGARIPDQAIQAGIAKDCSHVPWLSPPSKAGIAKEASTAERALADAKQRQLSQRCLGMMLRPKPVALVLTLTLALTRSLSLTTGMMLRRTQEESAPYTI